MNDKKYAMYHGYKIYEDGRIVNKHGKQLKHRRLGSNQLVVAIRINRTKYLPTVQRLVYTAFNPDEDLTNKIVKCSSDKIELSNLYVIKKEKRPYKACGFRKKVEIYDRYTEYKQNPKKYKNEIELLEWILKLK